METSASQSVGGVHLLNFMLSHAKIYPLGSLPSQTVLRYVETIFFGRILDVHNIMKENYMNMVHIALAPSSNACIPGITRGLVVLLCQQKRQQRVMTSLIEYSLPTPRVHMQDIFLNCTMTFTLPVMEKMSSGWMKGSIQMEVITPQEFILNMTSYMRTLTGVGTLVPTQVVTASAVPILMTSGCVHNQESASTSSCVVMDTPSVLMERMKMLTSVS